MADLAQDDIFADRRVKYVDVFSFFDVDYTGSTFLMQVRQVKDTTGPPLLSADSTSGNLILLYAGTATVSAHVTSGRLLGSGDDNVYEMINPATGVKYVGSDSLLLSQVEIALSAAALTAMPYPPEHGGDLVCWYDLIRTPSGSDPEIIMRGKFTVRAGVTIP